MKNTSQQRLLFQLISSCLQLHAKYTNKLTLQNQCKQLHIPQLLQLINFKHLGIEKERNITQIGICNIYQRYPLRISVYYLPKGQTMKLHDHPQIEVLNYLISGSMEARLYTHIYQNMYNKRVTKLSKGSTMFVDGQRGNEQNLHQFYALESSYFLDIIFPDYNEQRACTFYDQEKQQDNGKVKLRQTPNYNAQFTYLF